MRVTFTKLSSAETEVVVERKDGQVIRYPAGASRGFPQGFLHFLIESELEYPYGIYGRVAAGGSFPGILGEAGRRESSCTERADTIWRTAGPRSRKFEDLAGTFQRIALGHLDEQSPDHALSAVNEACKQEQRSGRLYDIYTVRTICSKIRHWRDSWQDLSPGTSVCVPWKVPVPEDLASAHRCSC